MKSIVALLGLVLALLPASSAFEDAGLRAKRAPSQTVDTADMQCAGGICQRSCSAEQHSDLLEAVRAAHGYARDSERYLARPGTPGERYRRWFGAPHPQRQGRLRVQFKRIADVLAGDQLSFNCRCEQDIFAWVDSDEPYLIHVCDKFWSARLLGTDSRAGTLIHEISHFEVVAGADDIAYDRGETRQLARRNPRSAVRNANNIEYFAENTPAYD
jgi:peptidyl-Lys metalloendopeptidase